MSQRHLYGIDYQSYNPPKEWEELPININFDSDALTANVNVNELTFEGDIASYVMNEYIPSYGVENGLHYRIESKSDITGAIVIVFDGYIDLSMANFMSVKEPIIFTAPIVDFNNVENVFDRMSIVTQGFLRDKGYITPTDFANIPTIRESKLTLVERRVILLNLVSRTLSAMINAIQNAFSAISDILGLSAPVGILELLSLLINVIVEFIAIKENIKENKDLFFPKIAYYKGMKYKTVIEKAFAYLGYSVEFGVIDSVLNNLYFLPSQDGYDGSIDIGYLFGDGQLKSSDYGYFVTNLIGIIKMMFNTREEVVGDVVHIRWRYDPFWDSGGGYNSENILIGTTEQYSNGYTVNKKIDATFFLSYKTDASDAHTLTEKIDDYYEVHRELITEIDPRTNTLKGLKEIAIPHAMCVRKKAFDNLYDLITGSNDIFSEMSIEIKKMFDAHMDVLSELDSFEDISDQISEFSDITGIDVTLQNRTGCLKIEDNTFITPKMLYMVEKDGDLRIPENFKDFIGGKALYNNWYLKDSPADVNDFEGQRKQVLNWTINFNTDNFIEVKENANFDLIDKEAIFTSLDWTVGGNKAVSNIDIKDTFDSNITEVEINQ